MKNKMNANIITEKLPIRKLSAISCRFLIFRNLQPTTCHSASSADKPASSADKLQPSPQNLQPTTYNLQPSRGFTLIEMLVSIAVFMVVMTVASGSLASIIDGNGKAQSLKSSINNLNFALESMAKNIRVGTDYSGGSNCSQQDACVGFASYKDSDGDGNKDYVVYRFNNNQSIERCVNLSGSTNCSNFTRLTAPEVHIEYANFYINKPALPAKPRVLIVAGGYAGTKERIKTKFNLQTTVSQRQF